MCQHAAVALYWVGAFTNLAKDVGFDVDAFIAAERDDALNGEHEPPAGMA